MKNEHGLPIYVEIHRSHRRSDDFNFGVMTGLIAEFTLEEMQRFRQHLCVVVGLVEEAFRSGDVKRNPCYQDGARAGEPASKGGKP